MKTQNEYEKEMVTSPDSVLRCKRCGKEHLTRIKADKCCEVSETALQIWEGTNPIEVTQTREWNMWKAIWDLLEKLTGKTNKELNGKEWRKLAIQIEKWAYFDRARRDAMREYGNENQKELADDFGLFWKGEG